MLLWIGADGALLDANVPARTLVHADSDCALTWGHFFPNEIERAQLQAFLTTSESGALPLLGLEERWLQLEKGAAPSDQDGAAPQIVGLCDITDMRLKLEQAGQKSERLANLLHLAQKDRQLLAFEIHDGLVQEMTGAQLFLEAGLAALGPQDGSEGSLAGVESIEDAAKWLRRSIEGARQLINDLEPAELAEAASLEEAIRMLADRGPLDPAMIHFESNDPITDLEPTLALSVYRVVQESLTNIWKHAEATEVHIQLEREDALLRLTVEDNGMGFDPSTASNKRFGLKGMRQRAIAFGGSLRIDSIVGKGATVELTLPIA